MAQPWKSRYEISDDKLTVKSGFFNISFRWCSLVDVSFFEFLFCDWS